MDDEHAGADAVGGGLESDAGFQEQDRPEKERWS